MKEWFKARNVWGATILALSDAEAGRIAKAIWSYTMNGEIMPLEGAEKGIFPMILMTLEQDESRDAEISVKRSKATESIRKQKISNDIKCNQMISNDIKSPNKNKNQNKNKESEQESESEFISDDGAAAITNEQNRILDAAEDAGFLKSNSVRAKLIDLYAVHGLDKMLAAINACVHHGVINLAYLEAVLKGEPKKKTLPSASYSQRDYSGENDREMDEMMDRMMAWGREKNGA